MTTQPAQGVARTIATLATRIAEFFGDNGFHYDSNSEQAVIEDHIGLFIKEDLESFLRATASPVVPLEVADVSVRTAVCIIRALDLDEAKYPDLKLTDEIADWVSAAIMQATPSPAQPSGAADAVSVAKQINSQVLAGDYVLDEWEMQQAAALIQAYGACCGTAGEAVREALEKLASSEAFEHCGVIPEDGIGRELRARMDFARKALAALSHPQPSQRGVEEAVVMVRTLRHRLETAKDLMDARGIDTSLEQVGLNLADELLAKHAHLSSSAGKPKGEAHNEVESAAA